MKDIANQVNARLGTKPSEIIYNQYSKEDFIEIIASLVNKYRKNYGIEVASPIIAQAILESNYGTSNKAHHNNYFEHSLLMRHNHLPLYLLNNVQDYSHL